MTTWIEQGQHNPLPGDTLTAIEQEGFGTVCAVLDYEGESVYRILRAVNCHDDLLAACSPIMNPMQILIMSMVPIIDSPEK